MLDLVPFKIKRKLPLLKDVLDRLFNASDADYLIYTNVDIALLPHFYLTVDRIIKSSIDSFVINRRTINLQNTGIGDIPLMYAEMGESHIGHDCFIFKRDIYPQFELGNVCVGIRLVGRVLLWNLVCIGQAF